MTPADHYRVKAGDLAALSKAETDPLGKAEYQRLSQAYLRLAEQADRNAGYVNVRPPFDQPQRPPGDRPQPQQARSFIAAPPPVKMYKPLLLTTAATVKR